MISSLIVLIMYFIPAIIALVRHHKSAFAIIIINVFFGWTMIGWFWALIWSASNPGTNTQTIIIR